MCVQTHSSRCYKKNGSDLCCFTGNHSRSHNIKSKTTDRCEVSVGSVSINRKLSQTRHSSHELSMILQRTHTFFFSRTALKLMQYLPPRPRAEIISHYVLWLHNVEEKKEKQEEISFKTLTPEHKKVLKVAGCTVQCATQTAESWTAFWMSTWENKKSQ